MQGAAKRRDRFQAISYSIKTKDINEERTLIMINIALDGPSGAGKSTLAKALAKKLGFIYTDTGAMYRTIGLAVRRREIAPTDKDAVIALLPEIKISLKFIDGAQKIFLGEEDVGGFIRTNEISSYASKVSAIRSSRTPKRTIGIWRKETSPSSPARIWQENRPR
jgi:cytidylate kinase